MQERKKPPLKHRQIGLVAIWFCVLLTGWSAVELLGTEWDGLGLVFLVCAIFMGLVTAAMTWAVVRESRKTNVSQ